MIDVKRLRYFVAVAEEQHFSRAAARLGISQPPLSEHIQALEQELGVALFRRTTRSVALTDDGLHFLPHARRILADIDQCGDIIRDARWQRMHSLRVGILHAHAYTFLPRLLAHWGQAHPGHRLSLVEHSTQDQTALLTEGTVDLSFVREPVLDAHLRVTRLFSEPYWIALPASWATAGPDAVSVQELNDKPMVSFPSHHASSSTRALFRDLFMKHKVKTADFLQIRTMHAALALVAAGQGFSPVPRSQTRLPIYGVKYLPLVEPAPELSVAVAGVHHAKSALQEQFVDFCTAYFSRSDWLEN